MKRKIIALVLTVVLCAGSLIGCGSGDNYFTELDKTIKHIGNTTESTVKIKVPKEAFVDASAMPIDVSNGLDATLKVLTQSDDKGNGSCLQQWCCGDNHYPRAHHRHAFPAGTGWPGSTPPPQVR